MRLLPALFLLHGLALNAQVVTVGQGSYTTQAPSGQTPPQSAVYKSFSGPALTHKFWSSKYWNPLGTLPNGGPVYMIPQPLAMESNANGLKLGFYNGVQNNGNYFAQPFQNDLTLGVQGLNASVVNVSAQHDWSVDLSWGSQMTATVGRGFPFVYLRTAGAPTVTFSGQPTVFSQNGATLGVSIGGNNYGLFCPSGGSWSGIGSATLTCNQPSGRNYFSLALLPNQGALSAYAGYAFSFPTNTQVSWNYNQSTAAVTTTYSVTTQALEGSQTGFLNALYPHQYTSLAGGANTAYTYPSDRGTLEVHAATTFTTTDIFHGILPFLPPTNGYSKQTLTSLLDQVAGESNHFTGSETYGLGKQFGRIAQLLPLAQTAGDANALANFKSTLEASMTSWFNAGGGKTSNLFYYDQNWGTLIGFPASYGSSDSLNDHHFHYGYWLHAAALTGLVDPAWLQTWSPNLDLLRRDIASIDRNDALFPYTRFFDAYAGHSWAAGAAPFGDGQNQESSSEAVNAWAGLILYGAATGNTQVRDAAIWMYTLETNAIFDYWFNDGPVATFPSGFNHTTIANVFDAKGDTGTFFGANPDFEHGIEWLPFTGGSLYLGRDPAYVQRNYNELYAQNGNRVGPDWPDIDEEYEAFANPQDALANFNATTYTFDGESRAHEYYWLNELAALGSPSTAITADTPLYSVFKTSSGQLTHAAFNASNAAATVHFSDGYSLSIPAGSIASEYGTVNLGTGATTGGGGSGSGGGSAPGLNGAHVLAPASSPGLVLDDAAASTATGNKIQIYTANGTAAQSWTLSNTNVQPAGYYNLAVLGPYCATATGAGSGSLIDLEPCNGAPGQAWQAVAQGGGYVFHSALDPNYCMDVRYSGTADGTQVQVWSCNGSGAQTWALK